MRLFAGPREDQGCLCVASIPAVSSFAGLFEEAVVKSLSGGTRAGGRITLGSDFPVESIDPLKGFYAAVTRLDENGNSPMGKDGW